MSDQHTASELWPLVQKLPRAERLRLARMALASTVEGQDAKAYIAQPVAPDEFSSEQDPLAWEAEGWEEFGASG